MKKIYDRRAVERQLKKSRHEKVLAELPVKLFVIACDRGEMVSSLDPKRELFQVITEGELEIYLIRADGARYSLNMGREGFVIGDMDLFTAGEGSVYAEAVTPLTCLAFDMQANRELLLNNAGFLRLLCGSLSDKLSSLLSAEAEPASLEDRVLTYMRCRCDKGILTGLEQSAFRLHCSSKQLSRILAELAERGLAEKCGRGAWRLTERPDHEA